MGQPGKSEEESFEPTRKILSLGMRMKAERIIRMLEADCRPQKEKKKKMGKN